MDLQDVLSIANTAVLVLTLIVLIVTTGVIGWQVHEARRARQSQQLLTLVQLQQDPRASDARYRVRHVLKNKPFGQWDDKDFADARRVSAAYDLAGILIREGLVDLELYLRNWGRAVYAHHRIVEPWLDQERRFTGYQVYDDFTWLHDRAAKRQGLRRRRS